ncbi:hypothetical protein QBC38DRAFT_60015 [Podospora fimiseda]|uniref:Uncharacterized protein n=1 Tax=Podospora fimiseda TaxID=252190 RepID=A0AAN7BGV7_9PEZI|nr:hypothetical protein QBC38DRAFT_60015 [Podospora fimiseda]
MSRKPFVITPNEESYFPKENPDQPINQASSNERLQQYQLKLMPLERDNKNRLIMECPSSVSQERDDGNGPTTPWGFVAYRTFYGDDALWERVKQKLEQARLNSINDMITNGFSRACTEASTIIYREDEAMLNGKTYADVRLLYNPQWGVPEDDGPDTTREIPPVHLAKPEGKEWRELCRYACLVIDHESMLSIDRAEPVRSERNPGWVWAIDTFEDHLSNGNEWDGRWKVDIYAIWSELYLQALWAEVDLIPYEIQQGRGDKIWRSADDW